MKRRFAIVRAVAGMVTIGLVAALVIGNLFMLSPTPVNAAGGGATVITHTNCFFFLAGGSYTGKASLRKTPSGHVNAQCHATLKSGTPVSHETRLKGVLFGSPFGIIPCDVVLTKSGNGNVSCHRK